MPVVVLSLDTLMFEAGGDLFAQEYIEGCYVRKCAGKFTGRFAQGY
jgi:hypothetical protein